MSRDRKSTRLNSRHTVIYTLSLHDALPISKRANYDRALVIAKSAHEFIGKLRPDFHFDHAVDVPRSEEHTSELQTHSDLHSFPTRRSSDLQTRQLRPSASDREVSARVHRQVAPGFSLRSRGRCP